MKTRIYAAPAVKGLKLWVEEARHNFRWVWKIIRNKLLVTCYLSLVNGGEKSNKHWVNTSGLLRGKCIISDLCLKKNRMPSKHDTLIQCWRNVRQASQTVVQHWTNIGSVYRSDWDKTLGLLNVYYDLHVCCLQWVFGPFILFSLVLLEKIQRSRKCWE